VVAARQLAPPITVRSTARSTAARATPAAGEYAGVVMVREVPLTVLAEYATESASEPSGRLSVSQSVFELLRVMVPLYE
jgi:hypothetical protein